MKKNKIQNRNPLNSHACVPLILVPRLMDRPLETTTTQATASTAAAAAIAAVSPGRQNGKRTDDDIRHRRQVGKRNFRNDKQNYLNSVSWQNGKISRLTRLENFWKFFEISLRNTDSYIYKMNHAKVIYQNTNFDKRRSLLHRKEGFEEDFYRIIW
jgi:hypothetical protein